MEKIRIKCPFCGAVLETLDNPANYEKTIKCPNCQTKNVFKDFKRVIPKKQSDETRINLPREETIGYLLDLQTHLQYPLKEGRNLIGRKTVKTPPKADIPIETTDAGMSREHLFIDVMRGRDGHIHVYASNAKNQNPTLVNGVELEDGDKLGLKHGDILRLCDTELRYMGYEFDDITTL